MPDIVYDGATYSPFIQIQEIAKTVNNLPRFNENNQITNPSGQVLLATGGSEFLSAAHNGLQPDSAADQSDLIESLLNTAMAAGKYLLVQPGDYTYSRTITVNSSLNKVGLVCLNGEAHFKFVGANLNSASINVLRPGGSSAGTYVAGFKMHGIRFTQPDRADTGLRNDAQEGGAALRLTSVEKVQITHCRFEHLYGSAMVLRNVRDVMLAYNTVRDIFKDGFHITGESTNIWRCFNVVDGGGDDAFPVVGYTNLTEKPRFIYDIGNRVRGVRYARGFAYVGCSDVVCADNYVDGLIPSDIPQKLSPAAEALNTRSGLYIAAEVFGATPAEKTYGNERITVTGLRITNTAPSGVAGQTTGYDAITIYSQNASNEDIRIEGVVQVPVANVMNISAVSLVRAIHLLPVDSLTATTVVVKGDVQDRYTTSTATVAFIDSRGFVLSSAQTPTNIAYASRSTTLTFGTVPAETAFIAQLQTSVAQTGRANAPQMLPKGLGMSMTYSGAVDVKVFQSEI